MSQSGFTPIQLYYSTTASNVPSASNLALGELAINIADGKLYYNSGGTVQLIAANLLPIANGGTFSTSIPTAGAISYGNGTSYKFTAVGTTGQLLTSAGAGVPTWSNIADIAVTSLSFGTTGLTPATATKGAITIAGTLAVANGGTGLTSTPANGALDIGNGTGFTRTTLTAGTGATITNTAGSITISATGTGGTVTSVGLSLPSIFTVTGSPVTTSGTLTATLATETANYVFAGPTTGAAAIPTFRALVAADIPSLPYGTGTVTSVSTAGTVSGITLTGGPITTTGTVTLGGTLAVLPSNFASQTANTFLAAPNGSAGTPTFRAIVAADVPGSALTKTDDTNVTLTLGGSPTTALLNAASLTLGWSGQLAVGRGGTGLSAGTSGGIPYFSSTSAMTSSALLTQYGVIYGGGAGASPVATAAGTTGQILTATTGGAPTWSSTYAGTVTSVSFTGGIITVATASTTPALTVAGTSGGIPYFSSGTTWASSAALTQYGVVYGGGAGAAPVSTAAGTTGQILSATTSGAPVWSSTYAGTVTSVAQSFTGGLISVAGSPITTSGTLALTVAGTSGGIPYFSSATTWATSAALAANAIVLGGGAGAAPATTTTGTGVVTALGVNTGTAGSFVVNGGALGTPSSGTVTNLTGTASININGTVGATTPAAGTFTTVTANTSVTTPFVTSAAATSLLLKSAGTTAITIDTSQNVGIATATPNAKLGVYSASSIANLTQWFGGTSDPNFITIAKSGATGATSGTVQFSLGMDYSTTYVDLAAIKFARGGGSQGIMQFFTGASANGTEAMRFDSAGNAQFQVGAVMPYAPAPTGIAAATTLTNAQIQGQIISATGTTYTITIPLGTTMETLATWATTNIGYDFFVINTATGIITMAVNTGVTSLGLLTIAAATSAHFRIRRTAANTFVLYRLV